MVRLIVGRHLEVPTLSILPQSRFFKDLGADDLDSIELVMVAEEAFDIEITDEEAEKIETVQDMVHAFEKWLKEETSMSVGTFSALSRQEEGDHINRATQVSWQAWQAARDYYAPLLPESKDGVRE